MGTRLEVQNSPGISADISPSNIRVSQYLCSQIVSGLKCYLLVSDCDKMADAQQGESTGGSQQSTGGGSPTPSLMVSSQ